MKHFTKQFKWLVMSMLLCICSSAWGETYTLGWGTASGEQGTYTNFTAASGSVSNIVSFSTAQNDGTTAPAYNSNNSDLRLYYHSGGNGGSITLTPAEGVTITGFVMTTSTSPSVNYKVDGGTATSVSASNNTYTVSNISASTSLEIQNVNTSNTQLRIKTIQITYTVASSYNITAQSNNNSYGTVSLSGTTITATPATGYTYDSPAYTVTSGTAEVTQNDNTFSVNASSDCTVQINFKAIPTYTVTLGDDNTTLTEVTGGAGVTLPTRNTLNGYEFAGWSETNVSTETTTAPTIIPARAYSPTADITLYPVYTKTEGGGGTENKTASVTISEYASANDWTNGTRYTSVNLDENITATGKENGNNSKYYSSSPGTWRHYAGDSGEITISTTNGDLTSITITYSGTTLKYGNDDVTSGTAIEVSGSSAVFSVSGTGNTQVSAISVNYTITGSGTTYYWSSPVAAAVEKPVISVADNPFLFSTTATITCATDGATIKYRYDENDPWSDYTSALTITETKTIYAKAIKDSDESSVAQVTATKNLAEPTVTIDASGITNTNVYDGTAAGSLSASVTYNDASVEGATVTWSGNNDAVATINPSTGAVSLVAAGSVTFTATFAANSDYSEKTATYPMTITNNDPNAKGTINNPYTVAEVIAMNPTSTSTAAPGQSDVYITGYIVGGFYNNAYTTTSTEFQQSNLALADSYNETIGSNVIPVQLSNNTTPRTTFNPKDHPGLVGVTKVLIKGDVLQYFSVPGLKNVDEMSAVSVLATISSAKMATFSSAFPLDFSEVTGMKAYVASGMNTENIMEFTKVDAIPAETGVVLTGEANTYEIPVASSTPAKPANLMVATLTEKSVEASTDGSYNYFLSNGANGVGFYKVVSNGVKSGAGKAYLHTETALKSVNDSDSKSRVAIVFIDNDNNTPTSIEAIETENSKFDGAIFNLAGQRVGKDYKGIVIKNGKKYLVK